MPHEETEHTQVLEQEPTAGPAPETTEGDEGRATPVRRRRRRGGRGRGKGSSGNGGNGTDGADALTVDAAPTTDAGATSDGDGPAPVAATETTASPTGDEAAGDGEPTAGRPRRRRGGRGRRRPATASGNADAASEATGAPDETDYPSLDDPPHAETAEAAGTTEAPVVRPRRSRGGRGRSRAKTDVTETAAEEAPAAAEPEPKEKKPAEPKPTRTRKARPLTRRRRREPAPELPHVDEKLMLMTEIGDRDQIAVLEDRVLAEHYITRTGARSMVGNIFLGKVQNVLPGMEAAFIDIGRGRNAVLYAGEVSYDEEIEGEAPRIEHVLRPGKNVLVQVTKDPMGGKGARLSQEISLPGRYLVLVPNSQTFGISRRLPDKERKRLKEILRDIKPPEHGLIVRTAAEDAPADDLRADLERLVVEWAAIAKSAKRGRAPRVLYEEPELTVRVVRDLFTGGEFKEIVTDSRPLYDRVVGYLRSVAPDLAEKVRFHDGPLPVLEAFHVVEQIHKALDRKVWLPSGGYLIFDRTEAMTVVDVNTGKHVGKANLEETVTKTNLEAAEEIARQLRLRDIGGIIIIDFIDMLFEQNKEKVISSLRNGLAQGKSRFQVFEISPLGLLEVTRKRVSAGLVESFSETCPTCEGRGILLTHKI